jgi:CPA2 family monovalent cation:H+ antiporter-2
MTSYGFLEEVGIALAAALAGGLIARALRLPVLVGYLLAGAVVGPYTPGVFVSPQAVGMVAHLGAALLMFAVGVHLSLKELGAVRRVALLGGSAQILATILLGILIGRAFGWSFYVSLFLGCALSLSSTAVMMRILEERGELGTTPGKVMLGICIVQDLSLVLMVALLPALAYLGADGSEALTAVGIAVVRAGLFIGATLLLAMRVVPRVLHYVARTGSHELFLLVAVGICLWAALSAHFAGLSMELGAFLAGVVVSESEYAHTVLAQVRPLRDVFASLFFVSVGMLLNPAFIAQNWDAVIAVVLTIGIGKSLISALVIYALGCHGRTAIVAGLGLGQIGEFSFVLTTIGGSQGLIPASIASLILSAALVTILLTPFVYQTAGPLYARLNRISALSRWLNRQGHVEPVPSTATATKPRVIVLGGGRVGGYVSDALRAKQVPHTVVEYDTTAAARLREHGVPVIYGDASSPTVLEKAHPEAAELAIVALPEEATTEMAIRALKQIAPNLTVVARVHTSAAIPAMHNVGADAVVQAEFEAGTEMIRQSLDRLGFADQEVDAYIEGLRQERYRKEEEEI